MVDRAPGVSDPSGRRRVGVFGGTFDPPHVGHLVTAVRMAERLDLDVVLLVVANVPWQKSGSRRISSAADRLDMVRAAIVGEQHLEACDVEIRRGGDTYTVDTLHAMRSVRPDDELVLILGSDAVNGLETWERWTELPGLCRIAVAERPGSVLAVPDGLVVEPVPVPRLDISSTELRQRVADGCSIRFLVPDGAVSIIEGRRLYRVGDDHDGP